MTDYANAAKTLVDVIKLLGQALWQMIAPRPAPIDEPPRPDVIVRMPPLKPPCDYEPPIVIRDRTDPANMRDQPITEAPPESEDPGTRLSAHFTVAEFTRSDKAKALGIDNTPTVEAIQNMRRTAHLLERIRAHLSALAGRDIPVFLSSGYRCPALNNAVGSSPGSAHVDGYGGDFTAPAFGDPLAVCKAIEASDIMGDIDQLIHEFGRWVHVSADPRKRNQVLTIYSVGGRAKTIGGLHAVK